MILVVLAIHLTACEEDFALPELADFSKQEREALGDALLAAYLDQPGVSLLAPGANNLPLFQLLDALYAQATNEYRLDQRAADRWRTARPWTLTVIDEESVTLIGFPGGHVVVSTGLLRNLTQEYELYYLLALEATLVQEGLLIEQLVEEYGLESLELIANAADPTTLVVFGNLVAAYPDLALSPSRLRRADMAARDLVCRSSLYRPDGALPLLEKFGEAAYFRLRPTYADRPAVLRAYLAADCGTLTTNGAYAQEVLPYL